MPQEPVIPLALSAEAMRDLGAGLIDRLVEYHDGLGRVTVGRVATPAELERLATAPLPEAPASARDVLAELDRDVWPNLLRIQHPRFFGFITSPSTFVGAVADALVSGFNPFSGTWLEGSGPAALELATIGWLRQWLDLPGTWGGHFTAGGSAANLTALAAARHARLADDPRGAVTYGSDQTHASVRKGLWLLGFDPDLFRSLRSDAEYRLAPDTLDQAVRRDRERGLRPFCVVANGGTTNTGAVDPLLELSRVCREHGLWLHVDGCYGLAAAFGERRRTRFAGLEQADSLSLDAHKWLFQPYECGSVLLRHPELLPAAFQTRAEYLQDVEGEPAEVNFSDEGLQLTRRLRALKLWMTFRVFGAGEMRRAVEHGIALGKHAARALAERDGWRVEAPAELAVVAFRYAPPDLPDEAADRLQRAIVSAVLAEGFAFVSSSMLRGRTVLRMNTINPRTTGSDVDRTVDHLDRVARRLADERR